MGKLNCKAYTVSADPSIAIDLTCALVMEDFFLCMKEVFLMGFGLLNVANGRTSQDTSVPLLTALFADVCTLKRKLNPPSWVSNSTSPMLMPSLQ